MMWLSASLKILPSAYGIDASLPIGGRRAGVRSWRHTSSRGSFLLQNSFAGKAVGLKRPTEPQSALAIRFGVWQFPHHGRGRAIAVAAQAPVRRRITWRDWFKAKWRWSPEAPPVSAGRLH